MRTATPTRRSSPTDQQVPEDTSSKVGAREPARTHQWSGAPAWASRATSVLLLGALCTGPVALVLAWASVSYEPVTHAAPSEVDLPAATAAGERAVHLVTAWLSATRDEPGELPVLYDGDVRTLPKVATEYRNPQVAALEEATTGTWSVTVGVEIHEPGAEVTDAPQSEVLDSKSGWQRRYFQVAVSAMGDGAAALTLPAPVPPPDLIDRPQVQARRSLTTTGPLGQTVTAFLSALVAGEGDLTRYTSPGTSYAPLTPPPYTGVRLSSLAATTAVDDTRAVPPDGTVVEVRAAAELTRADGQVTTAEYVLALSARAGRWEISDLAPVPALSTSSTTQP